jgi:glycosyltransferase involved in cell wall biosynthesis
MANVLSLGPGFRLKKSQFNIMATPLVSILMTAYNREKYIAEAIESALASSFEDFELIIVDDCSRDHTVEIARRYTSDPRVQVHVNEKNLGDYSNRNRAASLSRSRYLKYLDSDDYIYPRGLQIMVEMFEPFPEAAVGFCSFAQVRERPFPFQLSPREAYQYAYFNKTHPIFSRAPLSTIVRRDKFNAVGGFSGRQWVGDFELWHVLAARFPIVLMPDGIVWNREHTSQQMQANRTNPLVPFAYHVMATEQLMRAECPLLPEERKRALGIIRRRQSRCILRTALQGQPSVARDLLLNSRLRPGQVLAAAFSSPSSTVC